MKAKIRKVKDSYGAEISLIVLTAVVVVGYACVGSFLLG